MLLRLFLAKWTFGILLVTSLCPDSAALELSLGFLPGLPGRAKPFVPAGWGVTFPSLPLPAFLQARLLGPLWPPLKPSREELTSWAGARKPQVRPLQATPILWDSGIHPNPTSLMHLLCCGVKRREGLCRAACGP